MTDFEPTPEQQEILTAFKTGKNLKIHAFAGTGKTSTLEYLARSTQAKGLYVAFNKRVATEAARRMPNSVETSTIHAIAWKWAANLFPIEQLLQSPNRTKLAEHLDVAKITGFSRYKTLTTLALTLQAFCNSDCKRIKSKHLPWDHDAYKYETYQQVLQRDQRRLTDMAHQAWSLMSDPESDLPLGHDGYLKLWSLDGPVLNYDFLFVDEAQDLSPVMLSVLDTFPSQIVLVGDSQQQIYDWRGAVNAMAHDINALDCKLTTTFRFGQELSRLANRVLVSLGEDKALVSDKTAASTLAALGDTEMHACIFRKNATLLRKAVDLHSAGTAFHIADPNRNLEEAVRDYFRLKDGLWGRSSAFEGFNDWDTVISIAQKEDTNPFRGFVDLFETVDPATILKAIAFAKTKPGKSYPTLTTAHQAKGMEWQSVKLSEDFVIPSDVDGPDVSPEELRLFYVAMTRAVSKLDMPEMLLDFCQTSLGHKSQAFAVIDLETTGLSPDYGDRITEVGFVIWKNGKITGRFQSLVNPGIAIPAYVQSLTGITNAMVRNAPTSRAVLKAVMQIVGDIPLVAHNASFERKFLNTELAEVSPELSVSPLCTLLLSRRIFPDRSGYKLGDLVSAFDLPKGVAHRALSDAEMTAHLLGHILETIKSANETGQIPTPDILAQITKASPKSFRERGVAQGCAEAQRRYGKSVYTGQTFKAGSPSSKFQSEALKLLDPDNQTPKVPNTIATLRANKTLTYSAVKPDPEDQIWEATGAAPMRRPIKKRKAKWPWVLCGVILVAWLARSDPSDTTLPPASTVEVTLEANKPDFELKTGQVTAASLRHRACPSTTCETIGSSAAGDAVIVLGQAEGWYEIKTATSDGPETTSWVSAQYVRLVPGETTE